MCGKRLRHVALAATIVVAFTAPNASADEQVWYSLTVSIINPEGGSLGGISAPSSETKWFEDGLRYLFGSVVTVSVEPVYEYEGPRYRVKVWTGSDNAPCVGCESDTVTMTGNKIVTVEFAETPRPSVYVTVVGGHGSAWISTALFGNYSYMEEIDWGRRLEFYAQPDEGYEVASWSGTDDDTSTSTLNFLTVEKDTVVTVTFKKTEWTASEAHPFNWIDIFLGSDDMTCFIATAAYGSPLEPHVATLRQFRDEHLLTNPFGQLFVKTYYTLSPPLAHIIAKNEFLRACTRKLLEPIVTAVKTTQTPNATDPHKSTNDGP